MKFFEAVDEIVLRIGGESGVKHLAWVLFFSISGIVAHFVSPLEISPILQAVYIAGLVGIYFLLLLAERADRG